MRSLCGVNRVCLEGCNKLMEKRYCRGNGAGEIGEVILCCESSTRHLGSVISLNINCDEFHKDQGSEEIDT